jgi:hypothetical protein
MPVSVIAAGGLALLSCLFYYRQICVRLPLAHTPHRLSSVILFAPTAGTETAVTI